MYMQCKQKNQMNLVVLYKNPYTFHNINTQSKKHYDTENDTNTSL